MPHILLEVCGDSPAGFNAAVEGGADRIELCSSLSVGGLTPSPGFMAFAAKGARPSRAMIRPRASITSTAICRPEAGLSSAHGSVSTAGAETAS